MGIGSLPERRIAWLIEKSTDGTILAGAQWLRQPERGFDPWTNAAHTAMRFDSKEAAERYMVAHDISYARATEHAWYDNPAVHDTVEGVSTSLIEERAARIRAESERDLAIAAAQESRRLKEEAQAEVQRLRDLFFEHVGTDAL